MKGNNLVQFMTLSHWILYITLYGKDYNPKLIDFGMFSGGILPERWYGNGCDGYVDDYCKILDFKTEGGKTGNSDVYAYIWYSTPEPDIQKSLQRRHGGWDAGYE